MSLLGTYAGVVEDNKDPEKLGRLKVRVPHVYGAVGGTFGAITTENLPWAMPSGLPNGLSQQSGGCDWLPEMGDQVLVRFLDGEPEKPVYEWFMQTQAAAKNFKLHAYKDAADGVGKPKRGAWVRYGHTVEWNSDGLILTTSKGYRLLLTDASTKGNDGNINISTQAGQFMDMDDTTNTVSLNVNEDYQINVGNQMLAICDSISLNTMTNEIEMISGSYLSFDTVDNVEGTVGADWTMDVAGNTEFRLTGDWITTALANVQFTVTGDWINTVTGNWTTTVTGTTALTSTGNMTLTGTAQMTLEFAQLFLGTGSTEAYVLGNQLLTYLAQLVTMLQTHTHPGVESGPSTTAPPAVAFPIPTPALVSQVIKGR